MHREFISVEGTFNFRDVGGRPTTDGGHTRSGVLYRSASLDRLTGAGFKTISELDVEVVVDVRSSDEVDRHGRFAFEGTGIEWIHVPSPVGPPTGSLRDEMQETVFAASDPMAVIFTKIVEAGADVVASPLETLATASGPMVVHCTSGKDRTGLIAFLAQMICRVDPEQAFEDFELSSLALAEVRNDMQARFPEMEHFDQATIDRMSGAHREWIISALESVGGIGDLDPWLDSIGIDAPVRADIRKRMVAY